ncbi:MAG: hypothetical protein IJ710_02165, partial [Prevotella sp.]|nr:hypothetical protein [Prevotella sp.]
VTTVTEATAPGTYELTLTGGEAENYAFEFTAGTLTVIEADPITLTARSYQRTYGDDNPAFEFDSEGAALSGEPEITCEATAESPVGEYPIVITKGGVQNYNDSYVNGTLTITKATLTVSVDNAVRDTSQPNPDFTIHIDGFKNGETESVLISMPVAQTDATADSEPGEYAIVVSGGEALNYDFVYVDGILTITYPTGIDGITFARPVDVYTLGGVLVRHNVTSLSGLSDGVYIVNGRKVLVKRKR